jgi:hypothetical protein
MTKEVYIALIQKDLEELGILTEGLYENNIPSPTIIKLSSAKAQNIISNLQHLSELEETSVTEKIEEKEVIEVKKEIEETIEIEETTTIDEVIEIKEEIIKEEEPIEIKEEIIIVEKEIIEDREKIEERSTILKSNTTISDIVKPNEARLLDSLAKKKIDSIRKCISMGDRFLFQRELFDNKAELMNATLDFIDSCSNIKEAEQYIAEHFNWNPENEVVINFFTILNRRFN